MKYDFYNKDIFYKPGLAKHARDLLHKKILSGISGQSMLEIGVGFGEMAQYCRKNSIEWCGIDANQNLADAMTKEGFTMRVSEMPEFPELSEKFPILFASHFIEHLDNYRQAFTFLVKAKDHLHPKEGKIILLFPDIEKIGHYFWQDYTHSFVTSKKRIEDMLFDAGYKVVRSGHYTVCFFGILSTLISFSGKFFPFFLFPKKLALFFKLSFQQHAYVIASV